MILGEGLSLPPSAVKLATLCCPVCTRHELSIKPGLAGGRLLSEDVEAEFFLDECGDPAGVAKRLEFRELSPDGATMDRLPRLP